MEILVGVDCIDIYFDTCYGTLLELYVAAIVFSFPTEIL